LVAILIAVLGYYTAANFVGEEARQGNFWPDSSVRLGLDLRGGVHMVLSPDLEVAVSNELEHIRSGLADELPESAAHKSSIEEDQIRFDFETDTGSEALSKELEDYEILRSDRPSERSFLLRLTPDWKDQIRERAMLQALEVMRRRISDPATGIPESVVTRQGDARILVQIPGVSKIPPEFIQQTGFLEFKIVQDSELTEELLTAKHSDGLPDGTEIAIERNLETGDVLAAYLVTKEAPITGALLSDARVQFDNRRSEWQVAFSWNAEGAKVFGDLTEANVGAPLAIILDGQVYSAPVIRDRISRQGTISGSFSSEDAASLAVILRAGSLPIPVILEEERTIGPALGADSIRSGVNASVIGILVVIAFMIGYYRMSGGFAAIALLVNLTLLVGLLSLFKATLTLPGIAGLVLTVGMAVDANVIIFERIREELRGGKAVRAAISSGFEKARWTILDANITTLITAIILYEYGTGPIKGFAVTLSVGILTSVFSALIVTRLLYSFHPGQRNVAELSI
jgi:preprotein translocase subunit SecD